MIDSVSTYNICFVATSQCYKIWLVTPIGRDTHWINVRARHAAAPPAGGLKTVVAESCWLPLDVAMSRD